MHKNTQRMLEDQDVDYVCALYRTLSSLPNDYLSLVSFVFDYFRESGLSSYRTESIALAQAFSRKHFSLPDSCILPTEWSIRRKDAEKIFAHAIADRPMFQSFIAEDPVAGNRLVAQIVEVAVAAFDMAFKGLHHRTWRTANHVIIALGCEVEKGFSTKRLPQNLLRDFAESMAIASGRRIDRISMCDLLSDGKLELVGKINHRVSHKRIDPTDSHMGSTQVILLIESSSSDRLTKFGVTELEEKIADLKSLLLDGTFECDGAFWQLNGVIFVSDVATLNMLGMNHTSSSLMEVFLHCHTAAFENGLLFGEICDMYGYSDLSVENIDEIKIRATRVWSEFRIDFIKRLRSEVAEGITDDYWDRIRTCMRNIASQA